VARLDGVVARGQPRGDWPPGEGRQKHTMYDQTHHIIENVGQSFRNPSIPGPDDYSSPGEKASKNREMKEGPTILLIIKDGLREPTMQIGPRTRVRVWTLASELGDDSKKNNIENEGESHDIVENKGRNFLTHDVYDK
jgi:hypothetical protein